VAIRRAVAFGETREIPPERGDFRLTLFEPMLCALPSEFPNVRRRLRYQASNGGFYVRVRLLAIMATVFAVCGTGNFERCRRHSF